MICPAFDTTGHLIVTPLASVALITRKPID